MEDILELVEVCWHETFHEMAHSLMLENRFCDTEILTGTVSVLKENIENLYDAAVQLDIPQLQQLCEDHVQQLKADKAADKFETMTTMETQTEEALLKFASGEQETIGDANNSAEPSAGDDEAEAETNLEVWPVDGVDMLPEDAKLEFLEEPIERTKSTEDARLRDLTEKSYIAVADPSEREKRQSLRILKNPIKASSTESSAASASPTSSTRLMAKDMLFKCGMCDKFFSNKQGLERHAFLHTAGKGYTCDLCGKSFKTNRYLQAHAQRHNEEKNFQCSICGKRFKTQRDATWHKKTVHTSEKRFQCPHCNYAGKTRALLSQHLFSHRSAKKYECDTCGKSFLRKQHLEQHAARHEGSRKFMCSTCGAEFYTVYACKEHQLRIHEKMKKYECSVCHSQYNEKKSFLRHLQKHSVELVVKVDSDGEIAIEPGVQYIGNDPSATFINTAQQVQTLATGASSQDISDLDVGHNADVEFMQVPADGGDLTEVEYHVTVNEDTLETQYVEAVGSSTTISTTS